MITITENASSKIKEMIQNEEGNPFLRVGVKEGGCSGFSYGMGFDPEKNDTDTELEQHGIKILIDDYSERFIKGTVIDYKESMMGGGFTINNPNATVSCGCGSSFRTAEAEGKPADC
ncbi:HesB/IscA family protein [Bacillus horti]|uniref:Iron-sulfur cluster assembly protein n=1 Tax=Caldalkalibacillus horti TaxID=77523 RepID=A0ABT9VV09_9BACI|nr:iron-sulfur cluster assembly accessory protein [Bacillus horti]MDQ0164828.1 iron-sulfur cluster assembly protein [Bacillus horti]